MDAVRGAGIALSSNSTAAERDNSAQSGGGVETFTSDGFTIEQGTSNNNNQNNNNSAYVAWAWDAGSSTASNTNGSITSQVRASQTAGISILTYTGDGSGTDTIGHGLADAPSLVITKSRGTTGSWRVFTDVGGTWKIGNLNNNDAFVNAGVSAPTSSVFSVDGNSNASTTHIAYCFAPVAGYSAIGQFNGNGDSGGDGPFVHTGFAVQWLLIKGVDASNDNWKIFDNTRSPFNVADDWLATNKSNAEVTSNNNKVDFLSNGFKLRTTGGGDSNLSSKRYIYLAIAENPFQANGGLAR